MRLEPVEAGAALGVVIIIIANAPVIGQGEKGVPINQIGGGLKGADGSGRGGGGQFKMVKGRIPSVEMP